MISDITTTSLSLVLFGLEILVWVIDRVGMADGNAPGQRRPESDQVISHFVIAW